MTQTRVLAFWKLWPELRRHAEAEPEALRDPWLRIIDRLAEEGTLPFRLQDDILLGGILGEPASMLAVTQEDEKAFLHVGFDTMRCFVKQSVGDPNRHDRPMYTEAGMGQRQLGGFFNRLQLCCEELKYLSYDDMLGQPA